MPIQIYPILLTQGIHAVEAIELDERVNEDSSGGSYRVAQIRIRAKGQTVELTLFGQHGAPGAQAPQIVREIRQAP